MEFEIRPYQDTDAEAWLRAHAVIMSISHAWNYAIQERPDYGQAPNTRLVAMTEGRIAGVMDVLYDEDENRVCFLKDTPGGYVLEFGRLPEFAGHRLGGMLVDAAITDAKKLGFGRLEFWSQDRRAQRFYRRMGMNEIGRHYRFRLKPPEDVKSALLAHRMGVEYIYAVCAPEEWPLIQERFDVIRKPPLEPHLCVGFETRF